MKVHVFYIAVSDFQLHSFLKKQHTIRDYVEDERNL